MQDNYSFYYQDNNLLFGGKVLVVCYKANENEIEKYALTGNNIVLFMKSNLIEKVIKDDHDTNYFNIIPKLFKKEILFRIQSECLLGMYGDSHCDCETQKQEFISLLKDNNGIFIHMPQEAQGWGLFYKCKELELQVNGKNPTGKYIGKLNRDDAQKYLTNNESFEDKRGYELISRILSDLGLKKNKYVVYTESERKINDMIKEGLDAIKYSQYTNEKITSDNASEYFVKILNSTHSYSKEVIDKLCDVIIKREYNDRTLSTLIELVKKIEDDESFKIDSYAKEKILKSYNEIIYGEERDYILKYTSTKKKQNKFTCEVNPMIFKQLLNIYKKNTFDRLTFEKMHYFRNHENNNIVKVRSSKVLGVKDNDELYFVGQVYNVERIIYSGSNMVVEDATSLSKLRTLFENLDYDYTKRQEMITFVSEGSVPGVNFYLKRVPNRKNYILDVYGKKAKIREFVTKLTSQKVTSLLNFVSNVKLEDDNYSDYNLRFCDDIVATNEELDNFNMMKSEGEKYGNRS